MSEVQQYSSDPIVCGVGPTDAEIFIIGDAPNFTEAKFKQYGQGNSYNTLKNYLSSAGVDIEKCYYTPVVKCCKDAKGKIPANVLKEYKSVLEDELSEVKPKWVIALGANALKMVTRSTKITEVHGTVIEHKDGYKLFPALHPAMSLRDQRHVEAIQFDFKMFGKHYTGEGIKKHKLKYKWVKRKSLLREITARVRKGESFSYDLETNGLEMRLKTSEISLSILGFKDMVYVIDHDKFSHDDLHRFWKRIAAISFELGNTTSTANGKFDQLWLYYAYKIRMSNHFDVNLASHLLDENSPNGLKHNARVALEVDPWEVSTSVKQGKVRSYTQKKEQIEYAAWDGYSTLRLQELREKQLKEDGSLWNLFRWEVMPASNAYFIMETNGVCVNQESMLEAEEILNLKIKRQLRVMNRYIKYNPEFNWNSAKDLNDLLFNRLKLKPVAMTDGGEPSTAEDALIKMQSQHKIIKPLLEYRGLFKQLSGFIKGWQSRMIDGRLWPSFKIAGTVTGRPSCGDPNLQQVPRDPFIRSLITAPPGYVFFECDYSQAELRIAAVVANEPTMLATYRNGGDIHDETYLRIMGMSVEEAVAHIKDPQARKAQAKEERKKAKAVNFGFIYGMGWRKFMEYAESNYGVIYSDKEAKTARKRYFEVYTGLTPWHERQRKIVKAVKQVRTLTGRIRHLPQIDSPDRSVSSQAERLAINSPVQGMGAELGLMAISEITEYFNNDIVKMVGTIHDAIVGYVRIDAVLPALRRIQLIMQSPKVLDKMEIKLPIPIVADVTIGDWGVGDEMGKDFLNVKPVTKDSDGQIVIPPTYFGNRGKRRKSSKWPNSKKLLDDGWKIISRKEYLSDRPI